MGDDPIKAYRQVQIGSASPMQQVALLYESAISHVHRCRTLRHEGRYVAGGKEAAKAQAILIELTLHLDRRAGELANLYHQHYQAIYNLIAKGQLEKDDQALEQAQDLLESLLETWRHAMQSFRKDYYGA